MTKSTSAQTPLFAVFAGVEDQLPVAFKEQFLAHPDRAYDVVLEGVMHVIWQRPTWLRPLFIGLGWRRYYSTT